MNGYALLISILAVGAAAGPAIAQDQVTRITLDEALQLFGANSVDLRIARANAAEVTGLAHQSTAFPNPTVIGTHELLSGGGTEYTESYLNVSQRLEWPGTRSARGTAADDRIRAAAARLAADSARLAFAVKRAFIDALRAEVELRILTRVTEVFRTAEERAVRRLEAQDVSRFTVRRIQVELARYEADLVDASLEVSATRRTLRLHILPEEAGGTVAPVDWPAAVPPPVDLEHAVEQLMDGRPEVAAVNADLASAQATASAARRARIPDVTATGGYKRQTGALSGAFLGLSLPLPLWDRRGGAVAAATARVEAARARSIQVRRQIANDIQGAVDRYRALTRRAALRLRGEAAEQVDLLDIATIAYENGEMDLIELLDAAAAQHGAAMNQLRLRSDHWTSYYDLERALGGWDAPAPDESPENGR